MGTIEGYGGRQYCKMRRPPNIRLNGRHANVIAMLPLAHSTPVDLLDMKRMARHFWMQEGGRDRRSSTEYQPRWKTCR